MLKTTPNFALFDPLWGGMDEISIPIVEALPTTEPPKYLMAVHCVAAERGAAAVHDLYNRKRLCLTGSMSECRTAGMPTYWIDNHVTLPSDS